jgi:spermidine synthase
MRLREQVRLLVFAFFFVSGITGLVYEVAWTRMFTVVFGNTIQAASTVLAAYMGGLALGSLLLGKRADRFARPVFAYGVLEIGIGLYALVIPLIINHLTGVYAAVFAAFGQRPLPVTMLRFLLSFVVVLIPTTLMGATLPVLSKFAGREFARIGGNIGTLYSINTFGAVLGSFLTGFVLLEAIGVSNSVWLAAAGGIAIGAAAVAVGRKQQEPEPRLEEAPTPADSPRSPASNASGASRPAPTVRRTAEAQPEHGQHDIGRYTATVLLAAYAVSGAAALGYEVLYTKVLVFSLGLTAHAFSIMLTTFLVGLAAGSIIASRLVDRSRRPIEALAIIEVLIGATVFASIFLLRELDLAHSYLAIAESGGSLLRARGADFLECAVVMLPPTLLMGAAFPLVAKIYTRRNVVSSSVGRIYFFNTVGAVAGSLLAGFVLVPWIGTARSIALLASTNIALGILLFSCVGRRRTWLAAAAGSFAALLCVTYFISPSIFAKTFNMRQPGSRLLYFKEGASGTVTVHRFPDYDLLATDGVDVAGTSSMLRVTQKLQAHIPVLLAEDTGNIAHIGFGSGETLRILNLHDVGRIDGIEICKDVIATSRRFFSAINLNVFDRPNVNIIIMDGKNYVLLTRQDYDIIMTDSIYPGSGGASALYTYDHFKKVRDRLRPGGIASCWLPIDISKRDLQTALKAFYQAFPDMAVWYCYMTFSQHALLVGRKDGPIRIDVSEFMRAFSDPAVRSDFAGILIDDPFTLVASFIADGEAVRRFCADADANTDDRPALEFGIARRGTARAYLRANLEEMLALRPSPLPYLVGITEAGLDSAYVAGETLRRVMISSGIIAGHIQYAAGETGLAKTLYEKALLVDPANRIAQSCISQLDTIVSTLERAVETGAEDYATIYDLGVRYLAEGKFEQALAKLERARTLRPDLVDPYVSLGECYLRWGKHEKALKYFADADRIKPQDDGILLRIGVTYDQLGKRPEAKDAYRRAAAANPGNYEARNNLGNIYLGEGDSGSARKEFEQAARIAPARPHAVYNLGLTYAGEENWTEAVNYYREALRLAPTFYPASYSLGEALMQLGDERGAIEAWQRTLQIKPDHQGARQRLQAHQR